MDGALPRRERANVVRLATFIVAAVLLSLLCRSGPAAADPGGRCNSVVEYLNGAEMQLEAEDQAAVIKQALGDMLNDPVEALRKRRYSDNGSEPRQWDVVQLIAHQFNPSDGAARLNRKMF